MRSRTFAVAIFIGITAWSWTQETLPAGPRYVTPLRPMIELLHRANVSGSLEFSGCGSGSFPHFPRLRAPTLGGTSLVQTLSEMFADDPAMQVTQDADGTARMIERGVPTELLDVKISHIPFESRGIPLQYAAFSPIAALRTILHTQEVLAFAGAHDIRIPPLGGAALGNNSPYPIEWPHIVGSMDNLTLSQALDRVLKTFPGIWVYENCPCAEGKGRCVYLRFLNLHDPGLIGEE